MIGQKDGNGGTCTHWGEFGKFPLEDLGDLAHF